ncbi:MAG: hypothetical protein HeimAB125_11330 [Candidatus Heimdallarchaeota archaeon AB_125]|nr:MAG: hypothetical protein HeimAB125_11330 [Candidatus Heimdallarchaeota archaeon AB_125]
MAWTTEQLIAFWTLLTGGVYFLINFIIILVRTRVKGPEFVFVDVRIKLNKPTYFNKIYGHFHDTALEGETPVRYDCRFDFELFNIGDRMGILKITSVKLQIDLDTKSSIKPESKSDSFYLKSDERNGGHSTFYIDPKYKNWKKGKITYSGYYYNHKGVQKDYKLSFKGEKEVNKVWELDIKNPLKRLKMGIKRVTKSL